MAERPILFSAPMVRALLAGTKTQTRRVVKARKCPDIGCELAPSEIAGEEHLDRLCPYGQPGDRLWVRETWAAPHRYDHLGPSNIPVDGVRTHYAASEDRGGLRWRPSIHMPRWASRITLEVVGVRVERLQDISQDDARAEGAPPSHTSIDAVSREFGYPDFPRSWYAQLWDQINGPGSWDANPWVWVVEFKRIEA